MEDTLRAKITPYVRDKKQGLNPCFNGRYSQSAQLRDDENASFVLILVLMEDTLRDMI